METIDLEELMKILRMPGRYEVLSSGKNEFVAIPVRQDAIIIIPEAHKEAINHFLRSS